MIATMLRALLLLLASISAAAAAETWPTKPIRFVVTFSPGAATDVIARLLAERISPALGQPVVVENRPGAGGTIGTAVVAKAPADGYTVLIQSSAHTSNPTIYPNLPFDTEADFAGVTPVASLANVLVVAPQTGFKALPELIAAAKANPGKLNYASAGTGSATHMNAVKFHLASGIKAEHVAFKGTPEALGEIMAGRVDYIFAPIITGLPFIKDNRVVALAVGTAQRSPFLPQMPTLAELGVAGADYNFWIGMLVPAKTPREVVARLHAVSAEALKSPELTERFAAVGAVPMQMAPEAFDRFIRQEIADIAPIVKAAGIKLD